MALNLVLTLSLAFLHLSAGKLPWLDRIPQRLWLSFGGGVAIAYLFVEILPSLSAAQATLEGSSELSAVFLMERFYLLTLVGLTVFYGLELLAMQSSKSNKAIAGKDFAIPATFWLHIGSFAIYNALFSYLLNHTSRVLDCLLLFVAVALHYTVNDRNLRQHYKRTYDKVGRWILAGAILAGWALGLVMPVGEVAIALLKAFLAGGLILNVLQRELPKEQESCFWSFVTGAGVYTAILLLV